MADESEADGADRKEQIFFLNSYGALQTETGDGLVGDCFAVLTSDLQLGDAGDSPEQHPAVLSVETAAGTTLRSVTLPDGSQAFLSEGPAPKPGAEEEMVAQTLQLEHGSAVLVQHLPKILQGHEIKLEDGSCAFVPSESGEQVETFQPVELEDGTVAYITLTAGSVVDPGEVASLLGEGEQAPASDPADEDEDDRDEDDDELCVRDRNKNYVCPYRGCRKSYYTLHHLKFGCDGGALETRVLACVRQVHERTHTGDRPFRCTQSGCDKAFATGYGRKAHVRTHTGEKPYKCPEDTCGKRFKTSGDLQKHVRTHTGERPFRCPVAGCDRSFTTSNIRKVHVRTHTGERPYACPQEGCTRAFASATNYKNHLRIHSGEKPYVCTMQGCGKRFTEYSSLYKHHMVHTQHKPYFCVKCARHYRQASTLTMHKRTVHGIVEADDGSEIVFGDTVFTLANSFAGSKKLKKLGGNVLGFSKDGSTFLALDTSEDSSDPHNSHSQFLVVSDPTQLATLEVVRIGSVRRMLSAGAGRDGPHGRCGARRVTRRGRRTAICAHLVPASALAHAAGRTLYIALCLEPTPSINLPSLCKCDVFLFTQHVVLNRR
ncbi:zinc finger protein 143-like isoform X2 [Bacillus rossius redtenbacheri]|uniref:zinc finger protein 143-like isoform X2 n=1 Tax=Bacillus rossius redtenbacheri TaxID=93214 RepID=UPI002FDDE2D5